MYKLTDKIRKHYYEFETEEGVRWFMRNILGAKTIKQDRGGGVIRGYYSSSPDNSTEFIVAKKA